MPVEQRMLDCVRKKHGGFAAFKRAGRRKNFRDARRAAFVQQSLFRNKKRNRSERQGCGNSRERADGNLLFHPKNHGKKHRAAFVAFSFGSGAFFHDARRDLRRRPARAERFQSLQFSWNRFHSRLRSHRNFANRHAESARTF